MCMGVLPVARPSTQRRPAVGEGQLGAVCGPAASSGEVCHGGSMTSSDVVHCTCSMTPNMSCTQQRRCCTKRQIPLPSWTARACPGELNLHSHRKRQRSQHVFTTKPQPRFEEHCPARACLSPAGDEGAPLSRPPQPWKCPRSPGTPGSARAPWPAARVRSAAARELHGAHEGWSPWRDV